MPYGQILVDTVKDSLNNVLAPASSVFRNRIINGAMVISQRGTSFAAPANGDYTLDRWQYISSQSAKAAIAQDTTVYPAGFTSSLKVTSSSPYTVGASEKFTIRQCIEGVNVADLGWGTANAKTVTLSAWVYSSLTGTFGGSIYNYNANYSYPFSYSIPSANTWTQISITIVGPTAGTWDTGTAGGTEVNFSLGAGATVSGTAGSWSANGYFSATGATSVVGTSSATFYITGVQLEVGTNATSFDYRPFGTELQLCQRYFQKSYNQGTAPGSAVNIGTEWLTLSSYTGRIATTTRFAVSMRTSASVIPYDWVGAANRVRTSSGNGQTGYVLNGPSENNFGVDYTSVGISELLYQWSASAEL